MLDENFMSKSEIKELVNSSSTEMNGVVHEFTAKIENKFADKLYTKRALSYITKLITPIVKAY